jgi:hypothetical protein
MRPMSDTVTGCAARTGYLSLLLPVDIPEACRLTLIRQMVTEALAVTGEWPARVDIITHQRAQEDGRRRWFVEYHTGRTDAVLR